MNVLRWGANMVERSSPTVLIMAGTALAFASPPVRKTLRGAAVIATRGVLTAAETVQNSAAALREGMENIVTEAKTRVEPLPGVSAAANNDCTFLDAAKNQGHRIAVTAAAGAMAVRSQLQSIVDEAKSTSSMADESSKLPETENFNVPTAASQEAVPLNSPASIEARNVNEEAGNEHQVTAEEANSLLDETDTSEHDGLEAHEVDIGPDSPRRKRTRKQS